jgi:pimeloyl-ACP methyl ester carboxylesterase
LHAITPWWCLTCEEWASPPSPPGGFDKKTQAGDVAGVLDHLKIDRADLVTHDIGNMVGYASAAQYPEGVTRFVLMPELERYVGQHRIANPPAPPPAAELEGDIPGFLRRH